MSLPLPPFLGIDKLFDIFSISCPHLVHKILQNSEIKWDFDYDYLLTLSHNLQKKYIYLRWSSHMIERRWKPIKASFLRIKLKPIWWKSEIGRFYLGLFDYFEFRNIFIKIPVSWRIRQIHAIIAQSIRITIRIVI